MLSHSHSLVPEPKPQFKDSHLLILIMLAESHIHAPCVELVNSIILPSVSNLIFLPTSSSFLSSSERIWPKLALQPWRGGLDVAWEWSTEGQWVGPQSWHRLYRYRQLSRHRAWSAWMCCPVQAVCWNGEHTGRCPPPSLTRHGILPSALDFSSPSRMCLKAVYMCCHGQGWVSGSQFKEKTW